MWDLWFQHTDSFLKLIISLWLPWFFTAVHGLSPVAAGRTYSPIAVYLLLLVGASLVAEHRFLGPWASGAVTHRLTCSTVCGIFLDQGLNPCSLHWQVDS